MMHRMPRIRTAIVALLLAACSDGVADSYPQGTLVVGTVRRAGQPVAGIAVRLYGFIPPCREPTTLAPAMITGPDGRYRQQELSPYSPGTVFCGLARAFFARNGVPDSITVKDVPFRVFDLAAPDSTVIDFDLPE